MLSQAVPKVFQVIGEKDAILKPTRFPVFTGYNSDNPECGQYLCTRWDGNLGAKTIAPPSRLIERFKWPGRIRSNYVSLSGLSLAPLWATSKFTGKGNRLPGPVDYTDVPGLKQTIDIPEMYQAKGRLLVVWTVRVEGYAKVVNPTQIEKDNGLIAYDPWPDICHPWHGTLNQKFQRGKVKAALYVREPGKQWKKMGRELVIDIPAAVESSIHRVGDPTQSGSFLITHEDFTDKRLPESLETKIMWYNDTSMEIKSPANMRNMLVLLTLS